MYPDPNTQLAHSSSPAEPSPATQSRRRWWLIVGGLSAVLAVVAGVVLVVIRGHAASSDTTAIRALVDRFDTAVHSGDPKRMAADMCSLEAQPFLDDSSNPDSQPASSTKQPFTLSEIRVVANAASARLTFATGGTQTLYFCREAGKWTVCDAAQREIPGTAATSTTPTS
ncbi:Rv0361 family membrane protein [Nocardia sp. NPDC004722]